MRELEAEINKPETPLYQTVKHEAQPQKAWLQKITNIGKFFALVVVTVVSIKIASWLAGAIIVGGLAFIGYKLFFDSNISNKNR